MSKLVTRESIVELLEVESLRQHVIGRALKVLLSRQTQEEARANTTHQHNERGFMPQDARQGCIGAKTYIGRGHLLDFQIEYWMAPTKTGYPRIAKYHRQLNEAAVQRRSKQVA